MNVEWFFCYVDETYCYDRTWTSDIWYAFLFLVSGISDIRMRSLKSCLRGNQFRIANSLFLSRVCITRFIFFTWKVFLFRHKNDKRLQSQFLWYPLVFRFSAKLWKVFNVTSMYIIENNLFAEVKIAWMEEK